jgi:formyltetrahydrofolate deformylase
MQVTTSDHDTVCTLSLSCADQPGLVAKVAGYLAGRGGNILDAQQFNDRITDRFFMRVVFALPQGDSAEEWRAHFGDLAAEHGMDWRLRVNGESRRSC